MLALVECLSVLPLERTDVVVMHGQGEMYCEDLSDVDHCWMLISRGRRQSEEVVTHGPGQDPFLRLLNVDQS